MKSGPHQENSIGRDGKNIYYYHNRKGYHQHSVHFLFKSTSLRGWLAATQKSQLTTPHLKFVAYVAFCISFVSFPVYMATPTAHLVFRN